MYDKFKTLIQNDGFFYGLLIVVIAVASFGLGRLSVDQAPQTTPYMPITVTQTATVVEATVTPAGDVQTTSSSKKEYVGSKNGSKFHLLTCPGAKQISDENKVYFSSKQDAQKQGYTPASNCKGI